MGNLHIPSAARRLFMATLAAQLRSTGEPSYAELARLGAVLGVLGNRHMRHVARAAVHALGTSTTAQSVWRFIWDWWYQRSVDELIAFQTDRITPEWARAHVRAPDRMPPEACILLSMHQYNLVVAAACAVQLVPQLGIVSVVDPLPPDDADFDTDGFLLPPRERARALGSFYTRTFNGRMFTPTVAARRGLELIKRGGSLIVLPDFFGDVDGPILGRSISVARGPLWLARQSGRPIVPFLLIPPRRPEDQWRLWCGDPIEVSHERMVSTIEQGIRLLPATWPYWRGWHAAPLWSAPRNTPRA